MPEAQSAWSEAAITALLEELPNEPCGQGLHRIAWDQIPSPGDVLVTLRRSLRRCLLHHHLPPLPPAPPLPPVLPRPPAPPQAAAASCTTIATGAAQAAGTPASRRCLNEKLPYNEFAAEMGAWDSREARSPNLIMLQLWDQRAQELCQAESNGSIVPTGFHDHVFSAGSLEEWVEVAQTRLAALAHLTGGAVCPTPTPLPSTSHLSSWRSVERTMVHCLSRVWRASCGGCPSGR